MKKIFLLLLAPLFVFAEADFDRPNFHEFKDQQTIALENLEHTMGELRNEFAALAALLIEARKTNEHLQTIDSKLDELVKCSVRTLFSVETIAWNQEHSNSTKKPTPKHD